MGLTEYEIYARNTPLFESRLVATHQVGLMERAQSILWSCGCSLSKVLALAVYESSDALSFMAEPSSSLETALCLSSFSHSQGQGVRVIRGVSSSLCCCVVFAPSLQRGVAANAKKFGSGSLARARASVQNFGWVS
ncbi:hypothetical protein Bca4012_008955 [Brassica carinata]